MVPPVYFIGQVIQVTGPSYDTYQQQWHTSHANDIKNNVPSKHRSILDFTHTEFVMKVLHSYEITFPTKHKHTHCTLPTVV